MSIVKARCWQSKKMRYLKVAISDDKTWPKDLSWKNFKNFFSYAFASRVEDVDLDTPIYDNENE
jgi:hypothetical protein